MYTDLQITITCVIQDLEFKAEKSKIETDPKTKRRLMAVGVGWGAGFVCKCGGNEGKYTEKKKKLMKRVTVRRLQGWGVKEDTERLDLGW